MDQIFSDTVAYMSIIEMIWMANSIIGLTLSQRNFREALEDFRALGEIKNGRRKIASNSLIVEGFVTIKFILYLLIGLVASLSPGGPVTIIGMLTSTGLVLSALLLTVFSWTTRRTSQYLLKHGLQNRDSNGRFTKSTNSQGEDISE